MEATIGLIFSFSVFLVLFLGVGALAARRSAGTENDYLLGGRSFGKWMVGLSAGATGNTSFIIIAAVGMGYAQGVSAFSIPIGFALGDWIFWTFFAKSVSQQTEETGARTVAELITAKLRSKHSQIVRSLISILFFVFVGAYLVAQLSGSAKILNVFFGITPTAGVLIATAAILAYCTTGGLRASIWTDFVQALVMIAMTIGVMLIALNQVGGLSTLSAKLLQIDPTLLHLSRGHSIGSHIALIVGFVIIGICFGLSQPQVTVRVMAGISSKEVKNARWIYLSFIYATWASMVLFGICCRILLPDISDPEQALPVYAMANFTPWVVGLVLAGMFATIASTADSQILVCIKS